MRVPLFSKLAIFTDACTPIPHLYIRHNVSHAIRDLHKLKFLSSNAFCNYFFKILFSLNVSDKSSGIKGFYFCLFVCFLQKSCPEVPLIICIILISSRFPAACVHLGQADRGAAVGMNIILSGSSTRKRRRCGELAQNQLHSHSLKLQPVPGGEGSQIQSATEKI